MEKKKPLSDQELNNALGVIETGFNAITDYNIAQQVSEQHFLTIEQLGQKVGLKLGDSPNTKQMADLGRKISELNLPLESDEYHDIMRSYSQHVTRLFPWASSNKESKG